MCELLSGPSYRATKPSSTTARTVIILYSVGVSDDSRVFVQNDYSCWVGVDTNRPHVAPRVPKWSDH